MVARFNEAIVRAPSRAPSIAVRVVPEPSSEWWQELPSRPSVSGDELSVYLDHSRFQEPGALDPRIRVPTFVEIQADSPSRSPTLSDLEWVVEALVAFSTIDLICAWVDKPGNGAHPLDLLVGYERGLDKIPRQFPRLSCAWLLNDRSAGSILDGLEIEVRSRPQLALSRMGHSLIHIADLVSRVPQAKATLAQWVIPRDETTQRRELDRRLGEYSLPDGSRLFSEARWRALESQGLVLALADGEELVPLVPAEMADVLGPRGSLIPAIPMHTEDKHEYERELRAALRPAPAATDRVRALAEAAEVALLKFYSSFGSPYGAHLAQVVRSVLLDNQTAD